MKKSFLLAMVFALFRALAGAATLNHVITSAARDMCADVPKVASVAIVNFNSESDRVSLYIMEELPMPLRKTMRKWASRTNLPWVRQQLQPQDQGT